MIQSGIYKISSKLKPERFYIGSATNLHRRRKSHFVMLRRNKHHSIKLQHHFNKYGEKELKFEVLEYVENIEKLFEREQFYIDSLSPFFNICKTAGITLGYHHTEDAKQRMSIARSGKNHYNFGKHHSEETRKLQSLAKKGKKGMRERKPILQFDKFGNFIKEWSWSGEIKEKLGFHPSIIARAARGDMKTLYNFIWKYKNVA